jgi:hypothetical protein
VVPPERHDGYVEEIPGNYKRFQPLRHTIQQAPVPRPMYYPPFLCFRLLDHSQKEHALLDMLGNPQDPGFFVISPRVFQDVPGAPFCYWVSQHIRRFFTELLPFEGEDCTAKAGLCTGNDFRFVRAWWEVSTEHILDGVKGPKVNWPGRQ